MEHSFDIELAKEYGIKEAILLRNLFFWIQRNQINNKHFHKGKFWTYNSCKAFMELFPYMTQKEISGALQRLEEKGIIFSDSFNQTPYDRTKWYSLNFKKLPKDYQIKPLDKKENGNDERENQKDESSIEILQKGEPIPDIREQIKETNKEKQIKEEIPISQNPAMKMEMSLRLTNPLIDLFVRKRKELYYENPEDVRLTVTHHKERMHLQNILEHFNGDMKKIERYMYLFSTHSYYGKHKTDFVLSPSKFYNAIPDLRDTEHILNEEKKDKQYKEDLKKASQNLSDTFLNQAKKARDEIPHEEVQEVLEMFDRIKNETA